MVAKAFTPAAALYIASAVGALSMPDSARAQDVSYYDVPKGDGPHDVAPAPDGTVWYTGQRAGVLGRLDPKTGHVDRIKLGEDSAPHGVIVGPDGAPWVTDGGLKTVPTCVKWLAVQAKRGAESGTDRLVVVRFAERGQ